MPQSSLAAPLGTKAKADKEGPLSTTKGCVNVGISWHKWTLFYSLFLYREKNTSHQMLWLWRNMDELIPFLCLLG